MHRQDKIAIALCVASAGMGLIRPLVPEGWPSYLLYAVWLLPLFWFVPRVWRQLTPPCTLRQWWEMRRLGYNWMLGRKQFIHIPDRSATQSFEAFVEHNITAGFVAPHREGWTWHRWAEIGTDSREYSGGPCAEPVAAHVLACLENWGRK